MSAFCRAVTVLNDQAVEAATRAVAWRKACDDDQQTYFHGGLGDGYKAVARPVARQALNAYFASLAEQGVQFVDVREVERWKSAANDNAAIQVALSEKLNERDEAIRNAIESLDRLGGHRCREQAVFLAHIDSIRATLLNPLTPQSGQLSGYPFCREESS